MKPRLTTRAAGFSLIELLVSMVIGLVVTLAITSVMIRGEGSKRSTTSVNDLNQTGAYAAYVLDRSIRSAGSGFSQRWGEAYGCRIDASKGSTHVLPFPAALPSTSTFTGVTHPIRLAPFIIGKDLAGAGGDVLVVMAGTAGFGESPLSVVTGSVTAGNLRLPNTLGYRTGDLVLLADPGIAGGCMMQQVTFTAPATGSSDQNLPLAGTYYGATGTNVNLTAFGANTIAMQLGNAINNPPQFQMFGVGANNTLFSYDLLQTGGNEAPIADGIVEMRALYGLDNGATPDGVLDVWMDPTSGSGYEASVLTNGSAASQDKLRQIVAVRLGFILRTSLSERPQDYQAAAGTVLTLFGDLSGSLPQTRTLTTDEERSYRYRTVEVTIPLRNVMLAPPSRS